MNLLLFAGTTEGRELAERLRGLPVRIAVSVATEYGAEVLADLAEDVTVLVGRMDAPSMRALMVERDCGMVIDATHPYAADATANIRAAATEAGVPCLRLLRRESPRPACAYAASADEAAAMVAETEGNVLLTTGAKELAAYTAVPGYADRLYPRVLPSEESVRRCVELGFRRANIIAMQGPFGRELNLALMRHFAIAVMVAKDGGAEGGFPEKMLAAEDAGVRTIVIGRPPEVPGLEMDEIVAAVRRRLESES